MSHCSRARPRRIGWRLLVSVLVFVPLHGGPLAAQEVRGRLLDEATDAPVAGADVRLIAGNADEDAAAPVLTDSLGRFHLCATAAGRYRIRADRIGYRAVTSPPFDIGPEAPLEVEFRISGEAIPLAPLTVLSERPPLMPEIKLEVRGYYDRRERWGERGPRVGAFPGSRGDTE